MPRAITALSGLALAALCAAFPALARVPHPFVRAANASVEAPFRFLGPDSYADAMAIKGDTVVLGGDFKGADGFASGAILAWDGARWKDAYAGIDYGVMGLKFIASRLYAVGFFRSAGGCDSCDGSAYWESGAWHYMGQPFALNEFPQGLADYHDTLIASTNTGPYFWTGSVWKRFGPEIKGQPAKLEVYNGQLWLAGKFDAAPSVSNLMQWDGKAWSHPAGTDVEQVHDIMGHQGALFMMEELQVPVGLFRISRWDGKAWTDVTGESFGFYGGRFASDGKDLYMTGERFNEGFGLFKWDGSGFKLLDFQAGDNGETLFLGFTASGKLVQSANMTGIGTVRTDYASQWDGKAWSPMTAWKGPTGTVTYPTAMGSDGKRLYLGGNPLRQAGPNLVSHAAAWDGGNVWDTLDGGLHRPADNRLVDVNAWASGSDGMYAGGSFERASDGPAINVARWDGVAWHGLGDGFGGTVLGLTVSGADLIVCGHSDSAFKLGANALPVGHSIGLWHAGRWNAYGSGLSGTVNDAAEYQGNLYAAGHFALSVGGPRVGIAKWDGKDWIALADDPKDSIPLDSVFALKVFQGRLYALGREMGWEYPWKEALLAWDGNAWELVERVSQSTHLATDGKGLFVDAQRFTDLLDAAYVKVGRFDGANWILLGTEAAQSDLRSMALFGDYLYLGGWLGKIGGAPAAWLARWNLKGISGIGRQRRLLSRRGGSERAYVLMGRATLGDNLFRPDGRPVMPRKKSH